MSDADRLNEIQTELAEVLEARLSDLEELVKSTGSMSQTLISVEMELNRYRKSEEAKKDSQALLEGLSEIEDELQEVLAGQLSAVAAALNTTERLSRRIVTAGHELDRLASESRALEQENKTLESKLVALEENVVRMRKLKEDNLLTMAGLTQDMQGMASGKE